MAQVVIVGGGWAGCAAAIAAQKAGADQVILLERTDMLLGTGLVGGIMRNNGRYTATEELIALGCGELFELTDRLARHKNIDFPGHKHASLYDVSLIEPAVRELLMSLGIDLRFRKRVKDVIHDNGRLEAVITDSGEIITGEVFVDTSGTAGPQNNCKKYGNGCAMCVYRCPTFGPRVSLASKLGIKELMGKKQDGSYGAMSGSCKLHKDSLNRDIQEKLNKEGVVVIPIPEHLQKGEEALAKKACQQYALEEFNKNIILLDTGHAKLMTSFYSLEKLRQIPGLEAARYEDPYAGGVGNSVRFLAISPRDNTLKVIGAENLFCGGEKAGLLVGHTEAICTGTLSGHNAVRWLAKRELLELPGDLTIGDAISYVNQQLNTEEGITKKYTFSGSVYFARMKELGLYSTDVAEIKRRVKTTGLAGIFAQPVW